MVDSSVGGKTAVDLPAGKNLVGAFHPPRAVVADTTTLRTLPPRELRAGLAEVVKYGAIFEADFLTWLEANAASLLSGQEGAFRSAASHLILPTIVLGTIPLAVIARQTRSAMLEVLSEDYVRTARAKGLSAFRVVGMHALRNAMIPVVTTIGLQVGVMLAGAILTESIFSWPGIGKWMVDSVFKRDYPVIQGGLLIIAGIIMLVNLLVDLLYGLINPRIRH